MMVTDTRDRQRTIRVEYVTNWLISNQKQAQLSVYVQQAMYLCLCRSVLADTYVLFLNAIATSQLEYSNFTTAELTSVKFLIIL